jgi:hypothetical protein
VIRPAGWDDGSDDIGCVVKIMGRPSKRVKLCFRRRYFEDQYASPCKTLDVHVVANKGRHDHRDTSNAWTHAINASYTTMLEKTCHARYETA